MYQFIKRVLSSNRGTASVAKSASYQNYNVLGLPFRAGAKGGSPIIISDSYTVGTATYTTGSSDVASSIVLLFIHRAGWKCIYGLVSTDGLGASAGAGVTLAIGNGTTTGTTTANQYITATDFDAAATASLNATGHHYTPTTDQYVWLTYSAVVPVVGQHVYYTFMFVN